MSFTSRRDLNLAAAANAVSFLGDVVATFALVLRAQSHGAGAWTVAALMIADLAPIVALSGVVGRLADRYDSRRLLLASSLAQAALCTALAFVTAPPAALGLVFLLGAGQAVNAATWQGLIPSLVPPVELAGALGRVQAVTTTAGIAAPALAGVLFGLHGARLPLLVDAGTYLVITAAALLVRAHRVPVPPPAGERMRSGFASVRADPLLRATVAALGAFVLLGAAVNVVEVFLVRDTLHASAIWFGIESAAWSVGVLAGALLAARLATSRAQALGFATSAVVLAVGLAAIGLSPNVTVLMGFCVLGGAANGVLSVSTSTLLMGRAAPGERGRVGAVVGGVASGGQLSAYVLGAAAATITGPRQIFVAAGLLSLVVAVAFRRPVLRAAAASDSIRDATPALAPAR